MSDSPGPGHHGQGRLPPSHGNGSGQVVAAPGALTAPAVPASVAVNMAFTDADTARALLGRVIQRIFAAGFLLHAAPGHGHAACCAESALAELDGALSDIRATVLSWPAKPGHRRDHEPIDELGTAIGQLSVVAEIVGGLAANYAAGGDRTRWAASTDADHAVHRALLMLQHISRGCASPEQEPLARDPGAEAEG